jgi:hypothetical protein
VRGEGKRDPRPADSPGRLRQQANARKQSANLIPFLPGQTGNPEGKNGAKWLKQFRDYFDLPQQPGQPSRFLTVCQATYLKAIKGDVMAQRLIIEQMAGKAVNVDMTSSDGSMSPGLPAIRVVFGPPPAGSSELSAAEELVPVDEPG